MPPRSPASRRHALLVCLFAAGLGLSCAALIGAAALVPAPPAAMPLIAAIAVGCPFLVLSDARVSIGRLRFARVAPLGPAHLIRLRQELERLPETEHPLGL